MHVGMNFDATNVSHKKRLYAVLKALADVHPNKGPLDFLDESLGRPLSRGTDYLSNVRKGRFATSIAQQLYQWLQVNHFDLGRSLEPDWFSASYLSAWDRYVEDHGTHGALQIKRFVKDELNLIRKVRDRQNSDAELKLDEEFCFFLRTEFNVRAIMFERYQGEWHVIPLGENGTAIFKLLCNEPHFPTDGFGAIERLAEGSDLGLHRFALAVAENATDLPTTPDADAIKQGISLHYLDVSFSA